MTTTRLIILSPGTTPCLSLNSRRLIRFFASRCRRRLQKAPKPPPPMSPQQKEQPKPPWWYHLTIFPDPHGYTPELDAKQSIRWPKTYQQWKLVLAESWDIYKYSHEGWLLDERKGPSPLDADKEEQEGVLQQAIQGQKEQVRTNVRRNVEFLESETKQAITEVQKRTGIYTLDDLKRWAAEQMQLATTCLNEFMAGYRQGRDEEVEKMMTEYFQEFMEEESDEQKTKRRRRPMRRIRTAD